MVLSEEAARRFGEYVDRCGDVTAVTPTDQRELLGFTAWALVHERGALTAAFHYQSVMSERGFTDTKMQYVQTVIGTAVELIDAYEGEQNRSHEP